MFNILFRCKLKDSGEWVYWDALGRITTHTGKHSRVTIKLGAHAAYYYHTYQLMEKLDRSTFGQYTGMKDKDGMRMFEGDIVRYTETDQSGNMICTGSIEFTDGRFCPVPTSYSCGDDYYSYELHSFEVIGNIHDHPELIGGAGNG